MWWGEEIESGRRGEEGDECYKVTDIYLYLDKEEGGSVKREGGEGRRKHEKEGVWESGERRSMGGRR